MTRELNKELPIPRFGSCWYQHEGKPTDRFIAEAYFMQKFFPPHRLHILKLVPTGWDVREVKIKTLKLNPRVTKDPEYTFAWDAQFYMIDGGRVCRPDQVYTMKFFYPKSYPYQAPHISFLDENRHIIYSPKHLLNTAKIEGVIYPNACRDKHDSSQFYGHDPAHTTGAMHAFRGILWLRACLYARKYAVPMPDYG